MSVATVSDDISAGSTPAPRFYFMVVAANMIAVLGLMSNNPAVIIGAMLVAPLMTPIFGISLALIRGSRRVTTDRRGAGGPVAGLLLAYPLRCNHYRLKSRRRGRAESCSCSGAGSVRCTIRPEGHSRTPRCIRPTSRRTCGQGKQTRLDNRCLVANALITCRTLYCQV